MKTLIMKLALLGAMIIPLMMGCKQMDSFSKEGSGASDAVSTLTGISLNLDFSSLLRGAASTPSQSASSRSLQFNEATATYFAGSVTFQVAPSGASQVFDITGAVDASLDAKSDFVLALQGGTYNVTIDVSDDQQRYLGTATNVTIDVEHERLGTFRYGVIDQLHVDRLPGHTGFETHPLARTREVLADAGLPIQG